MGRKEVVGRKEEVIYQGTWLIRLRLKKNFGFLLTLLTDSKGSARSNTNRE